MLFDDLLNVPNQGLLDDLFDILNQPNQSGVDFSISLSPVYTEQRKGCIMFGGDTRDTKTTLLTVNYYGITPIETLLLGKAIVIEFSMRTMNEIHLAEYLTSCTITPRFPRTIEYKIKFPTLCGGRVINHKEKYHIRAQVFLWNQSDASRTHLCATASNEFRITSRGASTDVRRIVNGSKPKRKLSRDSASPLSD
jgi:hypothetical protein